MNLENFVDIEALHNACGRQAAEYYVKALATPLGSAERQTYTKVMEGFRQAKEGLLAVMLACTEG